MSGMQLLAQRRAKGAAAVRPRHLLFDVRGKSRGRPAAGCRSCSSRCEGVVLLFVGISLGAIVISFLLMLAFHIRQPTGSSTHLRLLRDDDDRLKTLPPSYWSFSNSLLKLLGLPSPSPNLFLKKIAVPASGEQNERSVPQPRGDPTTKHLSALCSLLSLSLSLSLSLTI